MITLDERNIHEYPAGCNEDSPCPGERLVGVLDVLQHRHED
jgi:hypothetical protein